FFNRFSLRSLIKIETMLAT
ncbi:hypothetical protein D030_4870B, partial [Vibrio parahaemolyticus AQ3810]